MLAQITPKKLNELHRNSIWTSAGGSGGITDNVTHMISQLPTHQQKEVTEKLIKFFASKGEDEN